MIAIQTFVGQPAQSSIYGNLTWCADLSQYRQQLIDLTRPQCANENDDDGDGLADWPADPDCASALDDTELPDQDGDGVDDAFDNCLEIANADQIDSDQDGYGNRCDADFDNNGVVGVNDVSRISSYFGLPATGIEAFDIDSSGAIRGGDIAYAANSFGKPPGPSGLACAGTIPCP